MRFQNNGVSRIVERIDCLREPFRKNAIEWLCGRTRRSLTDLQFDLEQFLSEQDPYVQEFFIRDTISVLDLAVANFGIRKPREVDIRQEYISELLGNTASVIHH